MSAGSLARESAFCFIDDDDDGNEKDVRFTEVPERKRERQNSVSPRYDVCYISRMIDRDLLIEAKTTEGLRKHASGENYPRYLIKAFGIGIAIFVTGIVVLLYGMVTSTSAANAAAAALLVLGSLATVLSLLRGEDIEDMAG